MASSGAASAFLSSTPEVSSLNQYWYSPASISALVAAAEEAAGPTGRIAFLSTPSLYFSVPAERRSRHAVFDYDTQWASDPGFVFFDFKAYEAAPLGGVAVPLIGGGGPLETPVGSGGGGGAGPPAELTLGGGGAPPSGAVPPSLHGTFDVVVIDPPYITAEVWRAYAGASAVLLARPPREGDGRVDLAGLVGPSAPLGGRVLCTTVAENLPLLQSLFPGLHRQVWQPSIPHLVYQYDAYANWDSTVLGMPNAEIV